MSKKLPKAIRPDATRSGGPEVRYRLAEPMPEAKRPAKPQQASSIAPEDLVATDIDAAERKGRARKLVERFSLYSGVAGLLPVPVVDVAAVGGVQLQMLRRISQLYDVPFSKNPGKAIGAMTAPALSVGATYVIGMTFVEHFARGGTLLDFEPPDHREFIKATAEVRKT